MQLKEFTYIIAYLTKDGRHLKKEYTVAALNDQAARIKAGKIFRSEYDRLTKPL